VARAASLLGVEVGQSDRVAELARTACGLPGLDHSIARRAVALARDLPARGGAIAPLLNELGGSGLAERVLEAGHLASLWGKPRLAKAAGHLLEDRSRPP